MEVPRELYERLVEAAIDLRCQIGWMQDEPRERWQNQWLEISALVDEAVTLRTTGLDDKQKE